MEENNDSTLNQKFLAAYLFGAPGQMSTETKHTRNPKHSDDPNLQVWRTKDKYLQPLEIKKNFAI